MLGNLFGKTSVIVSIHAPARGATLIVILSSIILTFQSTRPRGARRGQEYHVVQSHPVSIHAPARGATLLQRVLYIIMMFQSTRPRGARPSMLYFAEFY